MPSVASLLTRAAARYFGISGKTVARELARTAASRSGTAPRAEPTLTRPAETRLARSMGIAWLIGLALFALVVINVDLLLPDGAAAVLRLVIGLVLLIEGLGLLLRRSRFRTTLTARLTARYGRHPSRLRRSLSKHAIGSGLTLLGLAWLAAGALDLLRGLIALV